MPKGLRACPVCPACGSKKFKVIQKADKIVMECLSCARRLSV